MQRQNVNRRSRRQAGVSLVEVFVALLVLSVGLIALAKLQVDLVRGGGDTRARAAALALAEQKLEDLRTFSQRTSAAVWDVVVEDPTSTMAWSFIEDNKGGRIKSEPIVQAGVQYNLSWTATTQATEGPAGNSFYKVVEVTAEWTGGDNRPQPVTLSASIPDTPPSLTQQASTDMVGNLSGPLVAHVPGVQPEVIAIDVGPGLKRETSKPLPTVKKTADSTMVTFDVVTYHTNNNAVARREDFVTISCKCTFDGTGLARTPAKATLVGATLLRDQPGKVVTKTIGRPAGNAQQNPLCNICCRDHHDYTDGTDNYRYNPEANVNHAHYVKPTDRFAQVTTTAVTSGNYDEACRLKRVNGIFQVFEDWNLRTLTVLPKTDLEVGASKANEYRAAVQAFVTDYAAVKASGSGTPPSSLDFTPSPVALDPNAKQLVARAIYIDNMPENLLTRIDDILNDGDPANDLSALSLVPFYEVHLTKLADWISRDTAKTKAEVTSNAIPDQNNEVDDGTLDGAGSVYSRGLAQKQKNATEGDTTIIATARRYNTGITNTAPINTTEDEGHVITQETPGPYYYTNIDPEDPPPAEHRDGSMTVSVGEGISISGAFQKANGSPKKPVASQIDPPTGDNGAVCETDSAAGGIESYSCTVPVGWTGSITFSSRQGYSFCLADDGSAGGPCSALVGDEWTIPNPVETSITQDIYVWNP